MSDRCFICGEDNPNVLEEHHIVPRRYGGGNDVENLVTLCANCHTAVEKLYDERFYHKLGATPPRETDVSFEEVRTAVARFLTECDRVSVDPDARAPKRAVRDLYDEWRDRVGADVAPNPRQFGQALTELRSAVGGAQRRIDGDRVRVYTGICVDQAAADVA